jgi:hypothetical protein
MGALQHHLTASWVSAHSVQRDGTFYALWVVTSAPCSSTPEKKSFDHA